MKKACFFLLLFLCGCAPQKIWFNPTRNFTQAQTDLHDCQQSGEVPAPNDAPDQGVERPRREGNPVSTCMKARGYYLVDKKFTDTYRRTE